MEEIREINVDQVNVLVGMPAPVVPTAPPVTVEIGVPVVDLPAFDPLDFEPELQSPMPVVPTSKPAKPVEAELPKIRLPQVEKSSDETEEQEEQTLTQQVIEALPTVPQVTTVTVSSMIGVTAGVCTPFLLKLIRPIVKKAIKKLQKALGRQPVPEGVSARRALQRSLRG